MAEYGIGCFFLGVSLMAIGSWMIDRVRPTDNQQLRTYERRQKLAMRREQLRLNLDALQAVRVMQRGPGGRR